MDTRYFIWFYAINSQNSAPEPIGDPLGYTNYHTAVEYLTDVVLKNETDLQKTHVRKYIISERGHTPMFCRQLEAESKYSITRHIIARTNHDTGGTVLLVNFFKDKDAANQRAEMLNRNYGNGFYYAVQSMTFTD